MNGPACTKLLLSGDACMLLNGICEPFTNVNIQSFDWLSCEIPIPPWLEPQSYFCFWNLSKLQIIDCPHQLSLLKPNVYLYSDARFKGKIL